MALVVVGHRGAAPLLHRQAGLGSVERLDLALFVDAEHHGMGRRIDIEPDHIPEFLGEFGIVGELEGAQPMRLEPMPLPDAAHRGRADLRGLGHRRCGPVGRLMRRFPVGHCDHPVDRLGRQGRDARGPRLVAGEPRDPLPHEALLPTPHTGLVLAGLALDPARPNAVGRQQNDPYPPNVLLRAIAIRHDRRKTSTGGSINSDRNSLAHPPHSHTSRAAGIRLRSRLSDQIH